MRQGADEAAARAFGRLHAHIRALGGEVDVVTAIVADWIEGYKQTTTEVESLMRAYEQGIRDEEARLRVAANLSADPSSRDRRQ